MVSDAAKDCVCHATCALCVGDTEAAAMVAGACHTCSATGVSMVPAPAGGKVGTCAAAKATGTGAATVTVGKAAKGKECNSTTDKTGCADTLQCGTTTVAAAAKSTRLL